MTVAALPSIASYLENGVTTIFAVPFRFRAASDLIVERTAASGTVTLLALGVDYSVTGGSTDAGGALVLTAPGPSGGSLAINRDTAKSQDMTYTTGDRFPAISHESALDKQMLIAQELGDKAEDIKQRAVLSTHAIDPFTPVPDTFLGFDADGNPVSRLPPIQIVLASDLTANGSVDRSRDFATADGDGPFSLGRGRFVLASALAIHNAVDFGASGIVVIGDHDVTFAGGITAGDRQIFEFLGTGKVRGLASARQSWFDGNSRGLPGLAYPVTLCDGPLQSAFDALVDGGTLHGDPYIRIKGTAFIDPRGGNYEGGGCTFLWNSPTTNLFAFGVAAESRILRNFAAAPATPGRIPTSGVAILGYGSNHRISDVRIYDAYMGVAYEMGQINNINNVKFSGCRMFGLRNKIIDLVADDLILDAGSDWIDLIGITGSFNVGDLVIIDGSGGIITAAYDAYPSRRRIKFFDGMPIAGMNIQTNNGGSATILQVTIASQSGGVRTEGNVEAFTTGYIECFGGLYGFISVSATGAPGRAGNLAFSRMSSDTFFDSSYLGSIIEGAYGCYIDAWFANSRVRSAAGLVMRLCHRNYLSSQFEANSGWGLTVDGTNCAHLDLRGTEFDGNCRQTNSEANMAEMRVIGPLQNLTITGGRAGFLGLNNVQPPCSLWLDDAASDHIYITGFQTPLSGPGAIRNGSTGTHNDIGRMERSWIDPREMVGWVDGMTDHFVPMQQALDASRVRGIPVSANGDLVMTIASGSLDPAGATIKGVQQAYNRNSADPTTGGLVLRHNSANPLFQPTAGGFEIEGITYFDMQQPGTGSAPVTTRPPFMRIMPGVQVTDFTVQNIAVVNAFDFMEVMPAAGALAAGLIGDARIHNNRIFSIRHDFNIRGTAPEVVFLSDNIFSPGVDQNQAVFGNGGMLAKWKGKNGSHLTIDTGANSVDGWSSSNNYIFCARGGINILSGGMTVGTSIADKFDQVATVLQSVGNGTVDLSMKGGKIYSQTFGDATVTSDVISLAGSGIHQVTLDMNVGKTTGAWIRAFATLPSGANANRIVDRSTVYNTGGSATIVNNAPTGVLVAVGSYDK